MGDAPDPVRGPPAGTVEIIGHRGYAAAFPENTLTALAGALDAGAPSLEWDVHVAACGTPVVFHDDTLERTTGASGRLADRTAEELAALEAGAWFGRGFEGTPVPTLAEALRLALHRTDGPRARLVYPEIKSVREEADLDRILEEIGRADARDRCAVISLDFGILGGLRARDPEIALGWVVAEAEHLPGAEAAVRADARALLDPDWRLLLDDPERTRRWCDEGLPLVTWTVDDTGVADRLAELGVRRITTNRVGALLDWAGEWSRAHGTG